MSLSKASSSSGSVPPKTCPYHPASGSGSHIRRCVLPVALSVSSGLPFGYFLHKTNLSSASSIVSLCKLQDLTALQVLVAGAGSSSLAIVALNLAKVALPAIKPTNLNAAIAGGLLTGSGLYLAGTCPGTAFVQLGSCVPSAGFTIGGLLLGNALYGFAKDHLPVHLGDDGAVSTLAQTTPVVSIVVGAALLGVAYAIGLLPFGKKQDSNKPLLETPLALGAAAGSAQLLSMGLLTTGIGAQAGLASVTSQLLKAVGISNGYFASVRCGAQAVRSLYFSVGTVAGAYLSCTDCCKKTPGHSCKCGDSCAGSSCKCGCGSLSSKKKILAVVSGAMLGFGSALAKGDPYYHVFTGIPQLSVGSITAVASLLVGGVGTSLIAS